MKNTFACAILFAFTAALVCGQSPAPKKDPSPAELREVIAQQKQQIIELQELLQVARKASLGADVSKQFEDAQRQAFAEVQSADAEVKAEQKKSSDKAK